MSLLNPVYGLFDSAYFIENARAVSKRTLLDESRWCIDMQSTHGFTVYTFAYKVDSTCSSFS